MPPLTPGTNKKLTEVLNASFASWEKEVQSYKITKGKFASHINIKWGLIKGSSTQKRKTGEG